jgi:hypothetical protein
MTYLLDLLICCGAVAVIRIVFGDGVLWSPDAFVTYLIAGTIVTGFTVFRQSIDESENQDADKDGDDSKR